jgi:hypothetical protein
MSRYVFDLDGTLCSNVDEDYRNASPHIERITFVNTLYRNGHYIVINTARGMGRSNNDRKAAENAWYEVTAEQLEKWGILYHELHLGKPAGDLYIDDKGISDLEFFKPINS